jgi:hypothetical protein
MIKTPNKETFYAQNRKITDRKIFIGLVPGFRFNPTMISNGSGGLTGPAVEIRGT